jgi:hypothetical protein
MQQSKFCHFVSRVRKIAKNKTISFVMSVRPHVTIRLTGQFPRNFISEYFSKTCRKKIKLTLNSATSNRYFTGRPVYTLRADRCTPYGQTGVHFTGRPVYTLRADRCTLYGQAGVHFTGRPGYTFYHTSPSSSQNDKCCRQKL